MSSKEIACFIIIKKYNRGEKVMRMVICGQPTRINNKALLVKIKILIMKNETHKLAVSLKSLHFNYGFFGEVKSSCMIEKPKLMDKAE